MLAGPFAQNESALDPLGSTITAMPRSAQLALLLPLLAGCAYLRSPTVPMSLERHPAPAGNATGLVVLLPGIAGSPSTFVEQGVVQRIHEIRPDFDVVAPDAHFGYYRTRTFLERLHDDVIAPIAGDYEHIWFVGVSLGGFGAPVYAVDYPSRIEGMILIAPFMGDEEIIDEISSAGGLAAWQAPAPTANDDSAEGKFADVWRYFQRYTSAPETMPKLFIGRGVDDSVNRANTLLASVLPAGQNLASPGGHSWDVWRPLLDELIERALGKR